MDQFLTISANAAITVGTIRSVAVFFRKIIRDHIHQLGQLTDATTNLVESVTKLEHRVTALEQIVQKGAQIL